MYVCHDGYQGFSVEELYHMFSGDLGEEGTKSVTHYGYTVHAADEVNTTDAANTADPANTGATTTSSTQQRPAASQQVGQPVLRRKRLSGKWYQSFHEQHLRRSGITRSGATTSTTMAVLPPVMTTSAMTYNSAQLLEEHDSEVGDSPWGCWQLGPASTGRGVTKRGRGSRQGVVQAQAA